MEIESSFENLLDEEFRKTWFSTTAKHRFWDSLDFYIFDYLIDGAHLYSEAHEAIGISLYNQEEAKEIEKYLHFYQDVFEGELPDTYYVNHPQWPRLLEWTKEIIDMMEVNNIKYDFENDTKLSQELENRNNEKFGVICEELDAITSLSQKEKDEMKMRLFYSALDEFDDIANDILEKIRLAK